MSSFPQVLTMLFLMALRLASAPDPARKMRKYLRRVPIGCVVVHLVDYSLPGGPHLAWANEMGSWQDRLSINIGPVTDPDSRLVGMQ